MRNHLFCILTIALAMACSKTENPSPPVPAAREINLDYLKGTWYLNEWTSYHTLTIDDSSIVADMSIDTIIHFDYTLAGDSLLIGSSEPGKTMKNRILKLTKDSLIIDGMANSKGIRRYSATKGEYK